MISFTEKVIEAEINDHIPRRQRAKLQRSIHLWIDANDLAWWNREGPPLLAELKKAHPDFKITTDKFQLKIRWHPTQSTNSKPVYRADDILAVIAPRTPEEFATILLTSKTITSVKPNRRQATVVEGKILTNLA